MSFSFHKIGMVGSIVLVLLSACTLNTKPGPTSTPAPPAVTVTPNVIIVTPQVNLPAVGFPGLTSNGVTPCVLQNVSSSDVTVYIQPDSASSAVAAMQSGSGLPAFQYQNGWYAITYLIGSQQVTGWVAEAALRVDGDCVDALHPPTVCSVQPSVGRVIDLYTLPDRSSQIIGALGDRYHAALLEINPDGWFRVDVGNGQSGWIAPDEGKRVGPCPVG